MQRALTLIDTGPIVAMLNQSAPYHAACSAAFQEIPAPLLTCFDRKNFTVCRPASGQSLHRLPSIERGDFVSFGQTMSIRCLMSRTPSLAAISSPSQQRAAKTQKPSHAVFQPNIANIERNRFAVGSGG